MDRKLQRHRADSLRQHGFLVCNVLDQINGKRKVLHGVSSGRCLVANGLMQVTKYYYSKCTFSYSLYNWLHWAWSPTSYRNEPPKIQRKINISTKKYERLHVLQATLH